MAVKDKHMVVAANGATYFVTDVSDTEVILQASGQPVFIRIQKIVNGDISGSNPMTSYSVFVKNKHVGMTSRAGDAVFLAVEAIDSVVK